MTTQDPYLTQDLGSQARGTERGDGTNDPIQVFREPDNRIKLLLTIAALCALNLILLAWVLAEVSGGHEIVEVEGQQCIVVDEAEATALYCRR